MKQRDEDEDEIPLSREESTDPRDNEESEFDNRLSPLPDPFAIELEERAKRAKPED